MTGELDDGQVVMVYAGVTTVRRADPVALKLPTLFKPTEVT